MTRTRLYIIIGMGTHFFCMYLARCSWKFSFVGSSRVFLEFLLLLIKMFRDIFMFSFAVRMNALIWGLAFLACLWVEMRAIPGTALCRWCLVLLCEGGAYLESFSSS